MKARVKATGEIGIVANIDLLFGNKGYRYQSDEVEIINSYADVDTTKDVDYWEKLKHQAVIKIYCAYVEDNGCEWSLDQAIQEASALIEKLKEEK